MSQHLVVWVALALMGVLAVSVLGTVQRRERLAFVPGVLLVILGMTLLSGTAAGLAALVGLALVAASTVPMLLE
jgi:hypothetical protein